MHTLLLIKSGKWPTKCGKQRVVPGLLVFRYIWHMTNCSCFFSKSSTWNRQLKKEERSLTYRCGTTGNLPTYSKRISLKLWSPGQGSNLRTDMTERKTDKRVGVPRYSKSGPQPFDLGRRCVRLLRTNLLVKGWVSTDRSEVAALLITTPRPRTKSSTIDLTPPRRMGWISFRPAAHTDRWTEKTSYCGSTWPCGHIVASRRGGAKGIVAYPGGILT